MNRREFLQSTSALALALAAGVPSGLVGKSKTYDVFIWPEGDRFSIKMVPWASNAPMSSARAIPLKKINDIWVPVGDVGHPQAIYAGSVYFDDAECAIIYNQNKNT